MDRSITHTKEAKNKLEQRGNLLRSYINDQIPKEPTNMYPNTEWTINKRELTIIEYQINTTTYTIYWRVAENNNYEIYEQNTTTNTSKQTQFNTIQNTIQHILTNL